MHEFRHCVLLVLALFASPVICAAAAKPGQPAVWTERDLIVGFDHLPETYSCDDLWYKFHDVLLAIGARPDMRILAYQCGKGVGQLARSPQVHLHFFIPQAVRGPATRWADINVEPRTVRLLPGHPASIKASDCELLRQMKDGLLAALPTKVLQFNLACEAPATPWPFSVSVEALKPVPGQARVASR
ncbi:MAG TPA: hypothetical protein VI653_28015 [Steroidobacteraceae bacterium]